MKGTSNFLFQPVETDGLSSVNGTFSTSLELFQTFFLGAVTRSFLSGIFFHGGNDLSDKFEFVRMESYGRLYFRGVKWYLRYSQNLRFTTEIQ